MNIFNNNGLMLLGFTNIFFSFLYREIYTEKYLRWRSIVVYAKMVVVNMTDAKLLKLCQKWCSLFDSATLGNIVRQKITNTYIMSLFNIWMSLVQCFSKAFVIVTLSVWLISRPARGWKRNNSYLELVWKKLRCEKYLNSTFMVH